MDVQAGYNVSASEEQQSYAITRKKILIDDVDFFFSRFRDLMQNTGSTPQRREDDIMIQYCQIDEDLRGTQGDHLCKLLSFTFMIVAQLCRSLQEQRRDSQDQGSFEGQSIGLKVLYLIQVPEGLDPNLREYLNALKLSLLMSKCSIRLVIIEGERMTAGREPLSALTSSIMGSMNTQVLQVTDLAHFTTPYQFDEQLRFLMNGVITITNMRALNVEILNSIRDRNMFIFGSTHQKTLAFQQFMTAKRPAKVPVPPTLATVLHFLEKEQDKCPGFKYVLSELINK